MYINDVKKRCVVEIKQSSFIGSRIYRKYKPSLDYNISIL